MFDIQAETVTIVKSVTITLTGGQVEQLVAGLPAIIDMLDSYYDGTDLPPGIAALHPIEELLRDLAALGQPAPDPSKRLDPPTDDQRKYGRRLADISSFWIFDQHVTHGRTVQDIAAELGCHRSTVDYRLRNYRRDHPELEQASTDPQPAGPSSPAQDQDHGSDAG